MIRAHDDEGPPLFPAIVSLSLILHIGAGALVPVTSAATRERETFESRISLEAPPPLAPSPPPPLPPSPEPGPPARAIEAPRPTAPARPSAPKATVLEAATSANDVAIDAVVAHEVTMPAAPEAPAPVVSSAPPAPPPPAPRIDPGPVIVPARALGRMPRAPALDRELERNYPPEARRAGIAGSATLRLQVLSDGRLGRVEHLSESHPGFGAACERTVRAARWDPPLDRDGRAVATELKYVCKFEVRS